MEVQYLKFGNWVEYKKVDTLTRKVARTAVRKDNVIVASATIGSIIPNIDTPIPHIF